MQPGISSYPLPNSSVSPLETLLVVGNTDMPPSSSTRVSAEASREVTSIGTNSAGPVLNSASNLVAELQRPRLCDLYIERTPHIIDFVEIRRIIDSAIGMPARLTFPARVAMVEGASGADRVRLPLNL